MGDSTDERPDPVDGTVFETSTVLVLVCLLFGLFLTVAGAVLLVWLLSAAARNDPPSFKLIFGTAVGPLGAFFVFLGVRLLVRRKRLVVGEDRFQFVERVGGEDVVIAQVMYANVTGLALNRVGDAKVLSVRLARSNAAGTYDTGRYFRVVRPLADGRGYEARIPDDFRGGLSAIHEALDDAVVAWRAEQSDD